MALIDYIDAINRKVYLSSATVGVSWNPIDVYKEMRTLRENDTTLRNYDIFMEGKGNEPKGSGKFTERYVVMKDGTLFVPYDTTHITTVIGTVISDVGTEGVELFDRSPLSPATIVDINYVPPQVEIITVSSGSGLSQEEHDKLLSVPTETQNADAVFNKVVE